MGDKSVILVAILVNLTNFLLATPNEITFPKNI
jgi:hypothetical protein